MNETKYSIHHIIEHYLAINYWNMRTLYYMKEASNNRPCIVWLHLYEVFKIGKSIETENRLETSFSGKYESWNKNTPSGYGVSFSSNGNLLKLYYGNG